MGWFGGGGVFTDGFLRFLGKKEMFWYGFCMAFVRVSRFFGLIWCPLDDLCFLTRLAIGRRGSVALQLDK